MNLRSVNPTLRAAALLGSALLTAHAARPQFVQTVNRQAAPSVITLDPASADESANRPVVQGEASFAHPPANFYAFASARVGEPSSVESIKLRFSVPTTLGSLQSTADFPIEPGGSCVEGRLYAKDDTCIVLVRFRPQGAGRRLGKLTVAHAGSPEPDGVGLGGYGYEPVVSFTPALITTVPGTYPSSKGLLTSAKNLTVDGSDTLYIADIGNNAIREVDAANVFSYVTPVAPAESVAVDSFGLIYAISPGATDYFSYYDPFGSITEYYAPYNPGPCTPNAPCNLVNVGMGDPGSLTMDLDNNLFLEEATKGAMEAPVGGVLGGGLLATIDVWYLTDGFAPFSDPPTAFAVNANDTLFTAFNYPATHVCYIAEESLYSAESNDAEYTRVVGGLHCGFAGDGGPAGNAEIGTAVGQIAFDAAGDLYFSDTNNQRVRMIDAASGIITTIAGNGTAGYTGDGNQATSAKLSSPTGVAVDSQGQVYIISGAAATGTAQVVRKLGPKGFLAFSTQAIGTASAVHLITVTNTGNSSMTLNREVISGKNAAEFTISNNSTSCNLTAGAVLDAGQQCQIGVVFKPAATGARSATLTLLDNTVTHSNTVQLSGVGTSSAAKINPGSVTFPSTTQNQSATVPVTVTNDGNASLTISGITVGGTNPKMFTYTNSCGTGPIAPNATCNLQMTFKPTSAGSFSALVKVTDNAPDSPQGVAVSGTSIAPASSLVRLGSSANPASSCGPVALYVSVIAEGSGVPTGSVDLKKNGAVLATANLSKGTAAFTAKGLAAGSNLLTASYEGDANHAPSTSAPFTQVVKASQPCIVTPPITTGASLPTARP